MSTVAFNNFDLRNAVSNAAAIDEREEVVDSAAIAVNIACMRLGALI